MDMAGFTLYYLKIRLKKSIKRKISIRNMKGGILMTNRNDNRERMNKYPNNKKQDTEFSKETSIRSEITKKDLQK